MKKFLLAAGALAILAASASPSFAVTPIFAVYLDGDTSANGSGNGIIGTLTTDFGAGSFTIISTAQLDTPGFLNSYQSIIVSRSGASFGGGLDATAAANVQAYVGTVGSVNQGGVAVFTNDAADNLVGGEDVFDANINQLFENAATFAAASGHGYIGEFNGAVDAFASNSAGVNALDLLQGNASATAGYGPQFTYGVGPIGSGNPIDNGVTFPFTDGDTSTYLTTVTGANSGNIVDVYTSVNIVGDPAVLANSFVIQGGGGGVPEPATWAMLLVGFGGLGAMLRRRRSAISMA